MSSIVPWQGQDVCECSHPRSRHDRDDECRCDACGCRRFKGRPVPPPTGSIVF
jgi:hypothetical protein